MTTPRPDDLVQLREAARLVDRSPASLRRWIRDGVVPSYRGEGTAPENAPVLVSVAELRAAVVTAGKLAEPGRPPTVAPRGPSDAEVVDLRRELVEARHAADLARAELVGERSTSDALRLAVAAEGARARDLAAALEAERARVAGLSAELAALRTAERLPWWRRLLGVSTLATTPMIGPEVSTGSGSPGEA